MNMFEAMGIFVQVVDHGSFARAAQANQFHRPAVTKAIQQLERELGVQLLHRTTRKLSMTEEGEEFYQRCTQLLGDFADTLALFSPTRPPKGKLRLDMPTAVAKAIIVPALPDFRRRYPAIELVLRSSDHHVDLIGEGVDCAVRLGELADSSLVARRIGTIPMVTCGSPGYLARHGTPASLDDLDRHVAVNFLVQHGRRTLEWQFDAGDRIVTRQVPSDIVVDDSEAFHACGLAGLGLLQGLRPALQPYIDAGQLVEVLPHCKPVPRPISVVMTQRRHRPPKVDAFIGWLEALFVERGLA
ncbi:MULTISPECIES: LysR family transcriptional regulator [Cupriavidus]|uniref:LysR substrate-binding domain-containing protein n=1 Tax=Cupriavidus TaxID=106589 RepID=UPI00039E296A|nr:MULTISPECIES: LysR family transcriptional regulator [Cupriavidus]